MLYLDCGNSALKCLYHDEVTVLSHVSESFKDALKNYLHTLPPNTSSVLCSVASPDVFRLIKAELNHYFRLEVILVEPEASYLALKTGYADYKQLGIDRWLCLVGTLHISAPKIIIDAGSWIKMDVVFKKGQHKGGVIISKSSIEEAEIFSRFHIKKVSCDHAKTLFGTSTKSCLCLAKGLYGIDAIHVFLNRWLLYIQHPCQIIITGGDAVSVIASLKTMDAHLQTHILDIQHIENLVLLGLSSRYSP